MNSTLIVSGNLENLSAIADCVIKVAQEASLDKKTTYKLRLAVGLFHSKKFQNML